MHDRGEELDLLLVALRQLLGAPIGEVRDAEPGEPRSRLADGEVAGHALEAGEEDELVEHRHLRVQAAFLGQVAPGLSRELPVVRPAPRDRTRIGAQHAERDAHRRGLSRAVGAQEAEHVGLRDLELEPGESGDRAELLDEPVDREGHAGGSIAPDPLVVR